METVNFYRPLLYKGISERFDTQIKEYYWKITDGKQTKESLDKLQIEIATAGLYVVEFKLENNESTSLNNEIHKVRQLFNLF
jgi:hypothetical protein